MASPPGSLRRPSELPGPWAELPLSWTCLPACPSPGAPVLPLCYFALINSLRRDRLYCCIAFLLPSLTPAEGAEQQKYPPLQKTRGR